MSLTDLWSSSREQFEGKRLQQIISFAGSGQLTDGSDTSKELRDLLSHIPSATLAAFAEECLEDSFKGSGLALQDLVNQIGRRLGFEVEDGRYRGAREKIGYDGLWRTVEGHSLVVEVKTTDTYRMRLDVPAGYRKALVERAEIDASASSVLLVVGREDTGDLEAQIRGSRHAWDMRLISVDALLKLLRIKEELEDPFIVQKIGSVLIPQEYTRVDGIIDVVFLTAEDVREEPETEEAPSEEEPKFHPVAFNEECAARVQEHLDRTLVKQSRATWRSPDGGLAVLCTVSRRHTRSGMTTYWFAYHPHQRDFLKGAREAYAAFGCGSEDTVLPIPRDDFDGWLDGLNTTSRRDGRTYWHVQIQESEEGFKLLRKVDFDSVELSKYLLPTKTPS